jgi:glutamate-1-semialdehyde 2,1-aminomutase
MRAGLATLEKIERVKAHETLEEKTARFCDELNADFQQRGLPFQIARAASIFWLHAQTEKPIRRIDQIPSRHASAFAKIFHGALASGVYLAPSGYEVNFLSLAHSDELLERAHDAVLGAAEASGV